MSTTVLGKLKNSLTKKVLACPSCRRSLRVPVKPGKTLRVNCPTCRCQFDISFKSPMQQVFQWSKGYSMAHNVRFMIARFRALPMNAKAQILLFIFLLLFILDLLISQGARYINGHSSTVLENPAPETYQSTGIVI